MGHPDSFHAWLTCAAQKGSQRSLHGDVHWDGTLSPCWAGSASYMRPPSGARSMDLNYFHF